MKKILLFLVCIVSFVFTGCIATPVTVAAGSAVGLTRLAAGKVKSPQTYYPNLTSAQLKKSAKIVVYRTDMGGVSSILTVKANNKNYGMMPSNSYFIVFQENFKKNNIKLNFTSNRVGTKSFDLNVEVKQGKTYYVEVDTMTFVGVGAITAKVVEEDKVPKKFLNVADNIEF